MLEANSKPPADPRASWIPPSRWSAEEDDVDFARAATLATIPPVEGYNDSGGAPEESVMAYRFEKRIGIGGMGEVWSGVQESLGRSVAIKRIRHDRMVRVDMDGRRQLLREFRNEALAAALLEHPNIAPVYDFGADDHGDPMLAMKMVNGRPWDDLLHEQRAELGKEDFIGRHLPILISMGQAVAYAHAHGIVHRDLKPSQVMVGEFGEALLMDWGLAIRTGTVPGPMVNLRAISSLPTPEIAANPAGTPALMAPEQTGLDASRVGTHTDVFLLGATLYFLITGFYPFESSDGTSSLTLARSCEIPRPETRRPDLASPKELADLAMHAMMREPENRVPSAREFVARLQSYLSGEGRRRIAGERIDEARAVLAREARGYEDYARALASLEEARRHWPAHADIEPLREESLLRQAELALREGDFAFAKLQAGALPKGTQRDLLLAEVAREQDRRDRKASQLRMAGVAVVLLALIVAGVSTAFAQTMRAKNEELAKQKSLVEEQRGIAETKRGEAEKSRAVAMAQYRGTGGLVGFMLEELTRTLDMQLPHDQVVARTVADGTSNYYAGIDVTSLDDELLAEHATQLLSIAKSYVELGLYELSHETAKSSHAIRAKLFGEDSVEVAEVLAIEGGVLEHLAQVEEGIAMLRRSLANLEGRIPESDDRFIISLVNLGETLASQGEADQGLPFLQRALAIRETSRGSDHEFNSIQHNTAGALIELNRLDEAEAIIAAMGPHIEQFAGAESISMADMLYMRAQLFRAQGKTPEEILVPLEQAIAISLVARGPDHPFTITLMNNSALMKQKAGKVLEARETFMRLYEIRRARFGDNHPDTAVIMNNIGNTYTVLGDNETGLEWLHRAEVAYTTVGGPEFVDLAPILANIGLLHAEEGRFEEGVHPIERSIAIRTALYGDRHPGTMNSRAKMLMLQTYWARHEDSTQTPGASAHWEAAKATFADYREEALRIPPVSGILAEVLLRTGDREGATAHANAAIAKGYGANPRSNDEHKFVEICAELGLEVGSK